ncbi:MAG: hypothetical protein ACWGOY_02120 [Anaerolineales bacterium]
MHWYRSHKFPIFVQSLILVLLAVSLSVPSSNQVSLPITGRDISSLVSVIHLPPPTIDSWTSRGQIPSLNSFVDNLVNGQHASVRGVYVPGFMALPVVQQPSGNTGFVSQQPGTVTQFQLAARYGVIGLLAHNYLAGSDFFQLVEGLKVLVVKGDGSLQNYRITEVIEYQKVTPGSNWSHYINLETGERLTTYQVFTQYYQGEPHLTFQTCLEKDGLETWGLRFVVAEPIEA